MSDVNVDLTRHQKSQTLKIEIQSDLNREMQFVSYFKPHTNVA